MAKAQAQTALDSLDTRLTSVENNQKKQMTALCTIAERLGMSLTDEGRYFMESDNETVPRMGKQDSGGASPVIVPQPAVDAGTLAREVVRQLNENQPKAEPGTKTVSIDTASLLQGNKVLFNAITNPWNEWFNKYRKAFLKLHGFREVRVGDDVILAVDDDPEIPTSPFKDDRLRGTTDKQAGKSQKTSSGFWKPFACFVAIVGLFFCALIWWHGKRETERMEKQYLIYRYALEGGECYTFPQTTDKNIKEHGLDYVLDWYKREAEEARRKRLLGQ